MKVFYSDLLEFINDNPSMEELSNSLFQLGHEHEIKGESFEMEITPNRGDCLSLIGLARDLSCIYDTNLDLNIYEDKIRDLDLDFTNLSKETCPKISFLEIEIAGPVDIYEDYLESYYKKMGINKNNFFTDISNYLSYELGQPTHCFDKEQLTGNIVFEYKDCSEEFETLLGKKIQLTGKNCVFSNNGKIISLAGVMGGQKTACSKSSTKVLVECAFFNPEAIIGQTTKYNLQSDAAHKFERCTDIDSHEKVLRRFIKIVEDHVEIKSLRISSFEYQEMSEKKIEREVTKINSILGTSISDDFYKINLEKIGFTFDSNITIPSHRNDISNQNDLAEEIARIIGYNNISSQPVAFRNELQDKEKNSLKEVKDFFNHNGFYEVINFPFCSNENKHSISVDNPLDSNRKYLRGNLKDSLIENLLYNERRQKDCIKFFEVSDVYSNKEKIKHDFRLGIIASGRMGHDHNLFSKNIDRNYLEDLLKTIFHQDEFNIEEIQRHNLDTKIKNKIFYCEIDFNDSSLKSDFKFIDNQDIKFIKFNQTSDYPSSNRDFSFSIGNLDQYEKVLDHLDKMNHGNLKESFIFDFYKNEKLNEIKLGVRMIFQSNEKTLSDQEIQESALKILEPILELDGVSIPGME